MWGSLRLAPITLARVLALPDIMYMHLPSGIVHMYQTNMYISVKTAQNLMLVSQLLYIVMGTHCDCGDLFYCHHDILVR